MAVPFLFCDLLLHNGAADFGGIHIRLAVALTNDSDHLALGHFLQVVHILKADLHIAIPVPHIRIERLIPRRTHLPHGSPWR